MKTKNIAILIPTTSKNRTFESVEDCDLYKYTISSFEKIKNKEHRYLYLIGVDEDDIFYNNPKIREAFKKIPNVKIEWFEYPPSDGNVVFIWNDLYKKAYMNKDIKFDYFHQTGDDIVYMDKNMVNTAILKLREMNDLGVVGPKDWGRCQINPEDELLTQTFVGRSHYEMLGYYFHPFLRNWYCDNYITNLYKLNDRYFQLPQRIQNSGGLPRYVVDNAQDTYRECVLKDVGKLTYFEECKKRILYNI